MVQDLRWWLDDAAAEARATSGVVGSLGDPALALWMGTAGRTNSGVNVTPANARECPEVDACIGLIEDTIATVPVEFFERVNDDERKKRSDHPLYDLLHYEPNAWQTPAEFFQMMEGFRSTHGNAYAEIVPGAKGFASALEPIHPDEAHPVRLTGGEIGLRWNPQFGGQRLLMPGEFLHVKDKPFTRDLLRGQSRVERHAETIGRAIATCAYLSRFFSNGAIPKTFLIPPANAQTLTPDQVATLRKQFEDKHSGPDNQRRIGVLNAGFDLKTAGSTNEDAQVVETYLQAVLQLARIWGVPPHLIGETEKVTSWGSGIEQLSIGFVVYYMRPKFECWEQSLNAALMSRDTRRQFYFEFNVDGLLRGDFKTRMEGYGLLMQWGLMTVNEIRRQMNLPPVPGGDERLHPLNYAPATRIMDVLMKSNAAPKTPDEATRMLAEAVAFLRGTNPGLEGHA